MIHWANCLVRPIVLFGFNLSVAELAESFGLCEKTTESLGDFRFVLNRSQYDGGIQACECGFRHDRQNQQPIILF